MAENVIVGGHRIHGQWRPIQARTDGAAPVFGGQMCGLFSSNKVTSEAVACRNGSIRKGDRVQTQYEREEGGDDRWYCGVVVEAYTNGKVR